MKYKYKGKFYTLAEMYLNAGDYEPNMELQDVYRKAEAFDEICVLFERHFYANKESDINYLTDDEFVKAVEELRSNEGW